jgi:deoxyribose-phosphate aldolase
MIDHTLLRPEAVSGEVVKLCREAAEHAFGAVCVNPAYVPLAVSQLNGAMVRVGTVIGFPLGATSTAAKVAEAGRAVRDGALEFDVVLNLGALKDGRAAYVGEEISQVAAAVRGVQAGAVVKVILETTLLTHAEKVLGCRLAVEYGADMVKTSTGFGPGGATEDDVRLLRSVVGDRLGVKASGGIRDLKTALQMTAAGADRIGTSSGVKIITEWPEPDYSTVE